MISYCIRESEAIPFAQLLARLEPYGIVDAKSADADATAICITDGCNYLWCYPDPATSFIRYAPNGYPGIMLQAIADGFGVDIFNEEYLQDENDPLLPSYVPLQDASVSERIRRSVVSASAEGRAEQEEGRKASPPWTDDHCDVVHGVAMSEAVQKILDRIRR
jgi:hypothetical protein